MLVVNNGVPKSGSTLMQKALMLTGKFERSIGEWQNTKWMNISVPEERVGDFLRSDVWHSPRNICIKMHCSARLFRLPEQNELIRVITTYRNLKDSIVSMAYHNLRVQPEKNRPRDFWVKEYFSEPSRYGMTAKKLGMHYFDALNNGAYIVNYQDLVSQKSETLSNVYQFLHLSISEGQLSEICSITDPGIKSKQNIVEGAHVRTGGVSVAKDELPELTYSQLDILDSFLMGPAKNEREFSDLCDKVISGVRL